MNCKICQTNETNASSGICWKCSIKEMQELLSDYQIGLGEQKRVIIKTFIDTLSKPSVVSEFELAKAISEYYVKEGIPKAAEKCCFVAKIVHNLIMKGL